MNPIETEPYRSRMDAAPKDCPVCGVEDPHWKRFCFGCNRFLCRDHVLDKDKNGPVGPHEASAHVGLRYTATITKLRET